MTPPNLPNLPAIRLQLVGDGDCTLEDAVDVASRQIFPYSPPSKNMSLTLDTVHPPDSYFHPRFSRSLSMPSSSQFRLLPISLRNSDPPPPSPLPTSAAFSSREISLELADSLQSAINTILHVSPQQVLDPAKEQFAACTLSVPTPCMSAMLTTMKNLNYISANMAALCEDPKLPLHDFKMPHVTHVDFDIGELLQSVGDALSGAAAQVGADLVLYHGDVGLKHVWVRGDEDGLSYALVHTIRQILNTAKRGDTIELGLLTTHAQSSPSRPAVIATSPGPPDEPGGPMQFTFVILHKFSTPETRPKPSHSTLILQRTLHHIGATLVSDLPPPAFLTNGRFCELRLTLPRAKVSLPAPVRLETEADVVAPEPSLEQLSAFAETLKGKRVALYASSKGSFAHHFTSYLTAWGMDVSHVSLEGNAEGFTVATDKPKSLVSQEAGETAAFTPKEDASGQAPAPIRFIVIDDDVNSLKECLYSLRSDHHPYVMPKPSLSNLHRPHPPPPLSRSALGPFLVPSPAVILHFTSLLNYKPAKDMLQTVIASYTKSNIPTPEVMIIPKPVGPRRLLTVLHTAVTKPVIDPLFLPIATSPQSPGIFAHGTFFGTYTSESVQSDHKLPSKSATSRPNGGRTHTDRSTRSPTHPDHPSLHPTSPLGAPDSVEYFLRAADRLGGSPSSGLVIQSPDGQPTGIFFHPRVKGSSRMPSAQSMEREKGQLAPFDRRQSANRVAPNHPERNTTSQIQQQPPAPAVRASSTTGVPTPPHAKPIVRSKSGPGLEQASTSSAATEVQSPSAVVAPKSDTMQMIAQAVSSPVTAASGTTPTRRSVPRRRTPDSSTGPAATLPSKKPSAKDKGKTPENVIVPPISVLIVDDNPINQTILSTFMKKKKIQYDIANNGLEAVEKWKTGVFHLILMDIQMPVMDGIEATKEIRRMEKSTAQILYPTTPASSNDGGFSPANTPSELLPPESSRVPHSPYHPSVIIVALTASSLQSDRVAALGAGCNDFLTKPVSLLWLNSKIIEWGSIKALQMWADLRPSVMRSITHGQQAQARNIAERLHMPEGRKNPRSPHVPTSASTDNARQPSTSSDQNQSQNAIVQDRSGTQPGASASTGSSDTLGPTSETPKGDKSKTDIAAGSWTSSFLPWYTKAHVKSAAGDGENNDSSKSPRQSTTMRPSTKPCAETVINEMSKISRRPVSPLNGDTADEPAEHSQGTSSQEAPS